MQMIQSWIFGAIAFVAILASAYAHDALFGFHMGLIAVIALGGMVWRLRTMDVSAKKIPFREQPTGYMDDVIRAGVMVEVEPDRLKEIKVFVSQPREAVEGGSTRFHFKITDQSTAASASEATEFFAPSAERQSGQVTAE